MKFSCREKDYKVYLKHTNLSESLRLRVVKKGNTDLLLKIPRLLLTTLLTTRTYHTTAYFDRRNQNICGVIKLSG